uniref:Uncharacterized protein n=1 Tax=Amphimedon queenslandica TaxID=400682 RepID=A0A1X7VFS7_AMPQE
FQFKYKYGRLLKFDRSDY